MSGLEFDHTTHRYRLDGKSVPGVTEALKVISSVDYANVPPEVLAAKSAEGTAVHKLIELDCLGDLDLDSLDDQLMPYYHAWRDFLTASGFEVLMSERRMASRRYGYAGQLDLFGRLNGYCATIDAKRVTAVMPSTGPQTAAYTQLVRECYPNLLSATAPCQRYALQLIPGDATTARWKLVPFRDDAADLRLFMACLTVTNHFKRKHV